LLARLGTAMPCPYNFNTDRINGASKMRPRKTVLSTRNPYSGLFDSSTVIQNLLKNLRNFKYCLVLHASGTLLEFGEFSRL
jgi:hypothetical protein